MQSTTTTKPNKAGKQYTIDHPYCALQEVEGAPTFAATSKLHRNSLIHILSQIQNVLLLRFLGLLLRSTTIPSTTISSSSASTTSVVV